MPGGLMTEEYMAMPVPDNYNNYGGNYPENPYYAQEPNFQHNSAPLAPPAPGFRSPNMESSQMTEEKVRDILETFVSNSCCYGKDPATQMTIRDIAKLPVFRYELETFTERRSGNWKTVPYGGHQPNFTSGGPGNGQGVPPHMWQFVIAPNVRFEKGQTVVELPNTASITSCPRCQGSGKIQCNSCGGSGSTPCSSCSGMGHTTNVNPTTHANETNRCAFCFGSGRSSCGHCSRRGVQTCSTCEGNFRVKTYFELNVGWDCTSEECIVIDGDLNSKYQKYFKRVKGRVVIPGQCSSQAQPLDNFPDQGIQAASRALIQGMVKKNQNGGLERIIEFRQTVTEIKGTMVWFTWKNKEGKFLISGEDNGVHFPNSYPQLCCGCTIL